MTTPERAAMMADDLSADVREALNRLRNSPRNPLWVDACDIAADLITKLAAQVRALTEERDRLRGRIGKAYTAGVDLGVAIGEQNLKDGLS